MRKGWLGRLGIAAAFGILATASMGSAGCASERAPISQVGDNLLRKAELVGDDAKKPAEWYIRNTVVETRRTNPFVFPGEQDELKRIRWDIQENFLIARRSYEIVSGSDGKGAKPELNDGIIVAMYAIKSHVDVRRAYNSATGEEMNVLVENQSDRPWYDRDYIRVDWSRNLVSDPDFGGIWYPTVFGELQMRPVAYYETDPNSPNRPVFDLGKGYFDITAKWLMAPQQMNFWWGSVPACLMMNILSGSDVLGGPYDCNDQEVSVRTSFMKVADRDYEIGETNNAKWAMFGTFNRDRYGYDRQYEITDSNWHRLMARHNVWESSHDHARTCGRDGNGKMNADAECGKTAGSVCDMHRKECTIPYEQRKIRTVAYHLDAAMPTDLEPENVAIVKQWNEAMMAAIGYARETECRKGGGDAASCHGKWFDGETPKAENGPALVMCHNPVSDKDDKACGPAGTRARQGDLRFSLLGWIDQPLISAPLGYGPDGADPLTGEVVQATAYMYGAALDSYAAMTRDLVAIAMGDIKVEDFALGKHVTGSLGTYDPKKSPANPVFDGYAGHLAGQNKTYGMTDAEIKSRLGGLDLKNFVARLGGSDAIGTAASASAQLKAVNDLVATKGVEGAPGFGGLAEAEAKVASNAAKLRGTDIERLLVDDNYLIANAISDKVSRDAAATVASPFGGLDFLGAQQLKDTFRKELEHRGVCHFTADEFNAPHLEGLAKKLAGKYKDLEPADRKDKIFRELRKIIYKAVAEHEIGHTVAMRHNFQGSWDSMNFHPNYWALRTKKGTATGSCTAARPATAPDNCMGPRYLDPESKDEFGLDSEQHPGVEEFA